VTTPQIGLLRSAIYFLVRAYDHDRHRAFYAFSRALNISSDFNYMPHLTIGEVEQIAEFAHQQDQKGNFDLSPYGRRLLFALRSYLNQATEELWEVVREGRKRYPDNIDDMLYPDPPTRLLEGNYRLPTGAKRAELQDNLFVARWRRQTKQPKQ
jgi:hypothetical protein